MRRSCSMTGIRDLISAVIRAHSVSFPNSYSLPELRNGVASKVRLFTCAERIVSLSAPVRYPRSSLHLTQASKSSAIAD